jgi:hypothetical protein
MNKSTLFTTVVFLGCTLASFGQQTTKDIGLSSIDNMQNNMMVYPNLPVFPEYSIKNFGTTTVLPSDADSIYREFFVAGIKRTKRGVSLPPTGIAPGATLNGFVAKDALDWGTYGLSPGSNSVCGKSQFWKNGMLDANPSNDETCLVVNYSGDNNPFTYDFSISDVKIGDALYTYNDGDSVEPTMSIYQVLFTIGNTDINNGIPLGISFEVTASIDGTPSAPTGFVLTQPLGPTGTIPGVAMNVIGSVPSGKTTFDVCVELVASSYDTDHTNDKSCSSFNVKSYVGIEDEVEAQQFDMNYYNRNLTVNVLGNITGPVDINIMSVSGQRVLAESFNSNGSEVHEVDLSKLTSGAFIAIATTEKGVTETIRFVID